MLDICDLMSHYFEHIQIKCSLNQNLLPYFALNQKMYANLTKFKKIQLQNPTTSAITGASIKTTEARVN